GVPRPSRCRLAPSSGRQHAAAWIPTCLLVSDSPRHRAAPARSTTTAGRTLKRAETLLTPPATTSRTKHKKADVSIGLHPWLGARRQLLVIRQHQPQRMDHARDAAQEREHDVQPEVHPHADLQKRRDRRKDNRQDDLEDGHGGKCNRILWPILPVAFS